MARMYERTEKEEEKKRQFHGHHLCLADSDCRVGGRVVVTTVVRTRSPSQNTRKPGHGAHVGERGLCDNQRKGTYNLIMNAHFRLLRI